MCARCCRVGFEVISKITSIEFARSFFIHKELCKQRQHEAVQALGLNLDIFCIRMGGNIENIFLRKNLWESVHPATCKKVVNYHNIFAVGANFFDYLIAKAALTAEHSMFVPCYSCAKCLSNVDCIRPHKKNWLFFNIGSAEESG